MKKRREKWGKENDSAARSVRKEKGRTRGERRQHADLKGKEKEPSLLSPIQDVVMGGKERQFSCPTSWIKREKDGGRRRSGAK